MTSTLLNLVDKTIGQIQGYGAQQDTSTWINQTGGIDADDVSFVVNDTSQIGRGIIEVDDEIMYVDRVDNLTKTVYLAPFGRGFHGTTAAAHSNNARVTVASTYPRFAVKQAINDTVMASYPDLFGIGKAELTFNAAVTTYELPADAEYVLSVKWQILGPTKEWVPVRRYRVDKSANTTAFTSGRSISLFDGITAGRPIEIIYMKAPTLMSSLTDVYETTTGLPSSTTDIIIYGAIARLLGNVDVARIPSQSAENDIMDQTKPIGSAVNTARYYLGLYQQRLQIESKKLRDLYPIRVSYTR